MLNALSISNERAREWRLCGGEVNMNICVSGGNEGGGVSRVSVSKLCPENHLYCCLEAENRSQLPVTKMIWREISCHTLPHIWQCVLSPGKFPQMCLHIHTTSGRDVYILQNIVSLHYAFPNMSCINIGCVGRFPEWGSHHLTAKACRGGDWPWLMSSTQSVWLQSTLSHSHPAYITAHCVTAYRNDALSLTTEQALVHKW